jgi:16S rRNA (cytosine967-C5)-methyltransferase
MPATGGPGERPESARAVALRVIRRVTEQGAYSNLALGAELGRAKLSERDRRFTADLAYGTLRAKLRLDGALARASSRPLASVDPDALAILRLGAYQLLEGRIPAHAAVGETVALAPARSRGFVNAVLRRLAVTAPRVPEGHDARAVSARTGLTQWAVEELVRLLPADEVEPAASALAAPAGGISLRVNQCRSTEDTVRRRLIDEAGLDPHPGRFASDVVRVAGTAPTWLPGFTEGWFTVQDEASVLVAEAMATRPGERVLDACASPGGKASDLACRVGPDGSLVAADVSATRARLVAGTFRRLGVPGRTLVQDARRPAVRQGFDAVLVDAPCSGIGAARRRPELLWRPERSHLASLARLQVAILDGAASVLVRGGRLVYSVCTFPRAETDAAVRAFLSKRPDLEPMDVPGPDGPAPTHRLWPHRHGTDAMFFAGFTRRR